MMANGELPIIVSTSPTNGTIKSDGLVIGTAIVDGRTYYAASNYSGIYAICGHNLSTGAVNSLRYCSLDNHELYQSVSNYNDNSSATTVSLYSVSMATGISFYWSAGYPSLNIIDGLLLDYNSKEITLEEAIYNFLTGTHSDFPITYIPINSTLSGPASASSGDSVEVDVSFPDGYIYRESGISVYDTNGAIVHSYNPTTGKLTFTMP